MIDRFVTRRAALRLGASAVGAWALAACSSTPKQAAPPATQPATTVPSAPTAPSSAASASTSPGTTAGTLPSTTVAPAGGAARYVNHGAANGKQIALTFHLGGDAALVTQLLDLLHQRQVHASVFAIGQWITQHPAIGHRVLSDGHELGNHTEHHLSMLTLSRQQVRDEIVAGGQALIPFIGSIGKWFRPSGTDVPSSLILQEAGRAGYSVSVGYDIDSLDYTNPPATTVTQRVVPNLHAGAIVSLHFGHRSTIQALPTILDAIAAARLTPVTLSTMLG